jgi:cytochrome c
MHIAHRSAPLVLIGALLLGLSAAPAARASAQISAKSGCSACHAVSTKMIGPSFHDIAVKYKGRADAPALLSTQVRKGSTGVWGKLPMPASDATKINDADLKTVIVWILKTP